MESYWPLLLVAVPVVLVGALFLLRRRSGQPAPSAAAVQLDQESIRGVAGNLARSQRVEDGTDHLSVGKLEEAVEAIRQAHRLLASIPEDEDLVPAGRWILDNFFLLEQECHRVRSLLQAGPERLPIVRAEGCPRVLWLSDSLLSYTNGRLDADTLTMYLNEYQKKSPLTVKELWILPAFLRLAVLKRVAEVAAACIDTQKQWDGAENLADFMLSTSGDEVAWQIHIRRIPWMRQDNLGGAFLERLSVRLMEQGENAGQALGWLDQLLSERGFILEDQIASSHHRQSMEKLLIGNCMDSLRFLDALNWLDLFREVSVVERTLMEDPSGVYPRMDEQSRSLYRRRVEQLSQRWKVSELHLTRMAVQCAAEHASSTYEKERHIGFYLIGEGLSQLAVKVRGKAPANRPGLRLTAYAGSIWALAAVLAAAVALLLPHWGVRVVFFLAAMLTATKLTVFLVDEIVRRHVPSEVIPALDLKEGIPDEGRTVVVIPALVSDAGRLQALLGQLETLYLRHGGQNLRYCLLADFRDSAQPDAAEDDRLLRLGQQGVEALNQTYESDHFFFLIRRRMFCPAEGVYMGRERKRGALEDFNRLLLTGNAGPFLELDARPDGLGGAHYVLTLDADTELPHDCAARLIGMMLHPLNRPEVKGGAVRRGYGLLQPRVEMASAASRQSAFSAVFTGQCGLDHYTGAVADAYQDLFGEGIFTGKGIYDLTVFHEVLDGALPENQVLSHDLLEGSYVRAGFVSDSAVVDGFPSTVHSYFARMQRWIRGDWQLIGWLGRKAPGGLPNPISRLSRYKLCDNLRRSLVPIGQVAALLLSAAGGRLWVGLVLVILSEATPALVSLCSRLRQRAGGTAGLALRASRSDLQRPFYNLLFLPQEAWVALNAIVTSVWRMAVSHKHLLQWTTAADAERGRPRTASSTWRAMWVCPAAAVVLAALALLAPGWGGRAWGLAGLLWLLAPAVAWRVSQPIREEQEELTDEQRHAVRLVARRTWHYYERFVTAEEHYLAPDNFQEYPFKGVAARTSPTNIGLSLVANAVAMDLGYLTPRRMLERTAQTLETMNGLQKWQGHLYNWYDTRTTEPLRPLYVSTVDSGNLMAYLLLAAEVAEEVASGPLFRAACVEGLVDTIRVLCEKKPDGRLQGFADELMALRPQGSLKVLAELADRIAGAASDLGGKWVGLLTEQVDDLMDELEPVAEALALLAEADEAPDADWETLASPAAWLEGGIVAQAVAAAQAKGEKPRLQELLVRLRDRFDERRSLGVELASHLRRAAGEMNLLALYDRSRDLFHIGCNVEQSKLSNSYYDLLASEARLTSLIAVGWGRVPARHWRKLGRALTLAGGGVPLLSWGGTMFEYLMPALTVRHPSCTLLGETIRAVVGCQQQYGRVKGVPWGISESGYHEFDLNLNYQYRSFGVPALGMRAGLTRDLVIAPYASLMALPFAPVAAVENMNRLITLGMLGEYGMYEAMDYTPERRQEKDPFKIVKSYMVHHQGMALAAMDNLLCGDALQRRFHRIPQVRSVELLMEERAPSQGTVLERYEADESAPRGRKPREVRMVRTIPGGEGLWPPETHLLSNGSYVVQIAASGAGQSRWEDLSLNRWRDDAVTQDWGVFFYVKDQEDGRVWTTTSQPLITTPDEYETVFEPHMALFRRRDGDVTTSTEVCVLPDSPSEVRRLTFTNRGDRPRQLEVTAYFELSLNAQAADEAHTAFQNLFVQTEYLPEAGVVLARRRPRNTKEGTPYLACRFVGQGPVAPVQFDTSREACLGRGRTVRTPAFIDGGRVLGSTEGNVLDPAICLRATVSLPANATVNLTFLLSCGWERQKVLALSDSLANAGAIDRAFEMAWTQEQANMRYLGVKTNQLRLFAAMTSAVLYSQPVARVRHPVLEYVPAGQSALWQMGISGDLPIVLVKVGELEHLESVKHLLLAHAWWRFKGVAVDLVLLNEYGNDYRRPLLDRLHDVVMASHEREHLNKRGGIHLLTTNLQKPEALRTLLAVARCVLKAGQPLTPQLRPLLAGQAAPSPRERTLPDRWEEAPLPEVETVFDNGTGGFATGGEEYVIRLEEGLTTPLPWCNVLANQSFGLVATEAGPGYTWRGNSRENKLTPWYNDPVTGRAGEALYLRDRDTGDFWSPTAAPARGKGAYRVRHGQGWTSYEYGGYGLSQEYTIFVPVAGNVRVGLVKIFNPGPRAREIDLTWYCDFVLGVSWEQAAPFLAVHRDGQTGALWVENGYRDEDRGQRLFFAAPGQETTYTASRTEFLGVPGTLENPAGMYRQELSGSLGVGLGGCGALRFTLRIPPGLSRQVVLLLGQEESLEECRRTIGRFGGVDQAKAALKEVCQQWNRELSAFRVKTPDSAMDLMVNRWLLYQTKAARVLGRAGFYQAGGAIGFRDQLQDMLSLMWTDPKGVREHIVECAGHQFESGDVQHWWHPPTRGVRTHITDDLVFLPFVTADYIEHTGDVDILDEDVFYLKDVPIPDGQEDWYGVAEVSQVSEPLYLHCLRALRRAARTGEHGLPLIGTGDWNDAMNSVGDEGRGESVWLGWFLSVTQRRFAAVIRRIGLGEDADELEKGAAALEAALEEHGWDGAWYRRAFFDDGTPLGSAINDECRIDCISQAWAAISGRGNPQRVQSAMQAVEKHLVSWEEGILRLLWPPFANTAQEPGYIKGYLAGVRENGGQYTHGALWAVWAYAAMGLGDMAWRLLYMLNPIQHGGSPMGRDRYKAEPYVVAADVYSMPPLTGRGGWTWYTGSASWMYRIAMEELLGLKWRGDHLVIDPCIPAIWREYTMEARHDNALYLIRVENARGVSTGVRQVIFDGAALPDNRIPLTGDGETHHIHVLMGR